MANITQAEVIIAMSPATVLAIFDDDNDGELDEDSLDRFIARGSAYGDSWVAGVYTGPFPLTTMPIPSMLAEVSLQYTLFFIYERHPEFTRTLGENQDQRWKRAEGLGEKLAKSVQRITEMTPGNVGSVVHAKAGSTDDCPRIFDDMGRF